MQTEIHPSDYEGYDALLPPHWQRKQRRDEDGSLVYCFYNEISGEESEANPFDLFLQRKKMIGTEQQPHNEYVAPHSPASNSNNDRDIGTQDINFVQGTDSELPMKMPEGRYFEYYSTWSERDLYGRVTPYGLTIRYFPKGSDGSRTLIKFDGIVAEWVYSQLQGPFGPLEQLDLYIGAKVKVFGRQMSITAASAASINWIEAQRRKLERQQESFREKIMSVNVVPCVKSKSNSVPVRNITRNARAPGECDLRRLYNENARLGEQIAALGIAPHIF